MPLKPRVRSLLPLVALLIGATPARSLQAQNPTAAKPATPLDSLAGRWDFTVDLGSRKTPGELWVFRRNATLTGTLAITGTNTLPVRSLTLKGDSAHMIVDTPEGPVLFDGVVISSRTGMEGIVTYHGGQRFPMTATKRPVPTH